MQENLGVCKQSNLASAEILIEFHKAGKYRKIFLLYHGPSGLTLIESTACNLEEPETFIKRHGRDVGGGALPEDSRPMTGGRLEAISSSTA